jgi:hypothetical protein
MISPKRLYIVFGCLFALVALYGLMGFFQGIMLFTGVRALKNANIWGSVFLLALIASVSFFMAARKGISHYSFRRILGHKAVTFFAFAIVLLILNPVFRDVIAIDHCLDSGGSFDHVRSVCDFKQPHASMSLFERQGFLLVAALMFALPVLLAAAKWFRPRP